VEKTELRNKEMYKAYSKSEKTRTEIAQSERK